jgi:O-antigen ligase
MDSRTFWLGLLGGVLTGALIIAAGYFALKAYLPPPDDDPLYNAKQSFLSSGTQLSRQEAEAEIQFLNRERAPALLMS